MERHNRRGIGIIGGTFNPVHIAHLIIAEEVHATLAFDEILFVPAGQPPHKSGHGITAAHHRLAMLELAIASNAHFSLSRVEIERPGPSYLVDTLCILHEQLGAGCDLSFIVGWDSLEELHTWHQPLAILSQLKHLVAVKRPSYTVDDVYTRQLETRLPGIMQRLLIVETPLLEISSSELRRRVAEGRPIKYQVPEAVEEYIRAHHLYA